MGKVNECLYCVNALTTAVQLQFHCLLGRYQGDLDYEPSELLTPALVLLSTPRKIYFPCPTHDLHHMSDACGLITARQP